MWMPKHKGIEETDCLIKKKSKCGPISKESYSKGVLRHEINNFI